MPLLLAVDQGTTSSRAIIFDAVTGEVLASSQHRHTQISPRPGWYEHNPAEILGMVNVCLDDVARSLTELGRPLSDVRACGLTCQRETVVVWDRESGIPLYNAIVWLDTRTLSRVEALKAEWGERFQIRTGLPLSTYFSASKLQWLWENIPAVRTAFERKTACIGTVDSWLMFKLLEEVSGEENREPEIETGIDTCKSSRSRRCHCGVPVHKTDVTNASRTFLYDIVAGKWDPELCELFHVPIECLPEVYPSASMHSHNVFGVIASGPFAGVPVAGVAGDQHASLFGHCCFTEGSSKCTFGTGAFLLQNAGTAFRVASSGILTTVAYKLDEELPMVYAFEGSVAVAGSALEWLHSIGVIDDISEVDEMVQKALQLEKQAADDLAAREGVQDGSGGRDGSDEHKCCPTVPKEETRDSNMLADKTENPEESGPHRKSAESREARVVFVPAFSGLYCPYWRSDARGVLIGLTQHTTRYHIVKAALEAVAFQVNDLVSAFAASRPESTPQKKLGGKLEPRISASSPVEECGKTPGRQGALASASCLSVDGGMTKSSLFLQILADILDSHIKRPECPEITSLGAAALAGLSVGVYPDLDAVRAAIRGGRGLTSPAMPSAERGELLTTWRRAVERSFGLAG